MWEPEGSWTFDGPSVPILPTVPTIPMAWYDAFTDAVRVLLVDHNKESLTSTAKMLESYSYKVTPVELGSEALPIITEKRDQFDLLLSETHLPEVDGFRLLREAIKMELPTIIMSPDEDAMMAKMALENGACFFIEKPVNMEVLKTLWQHVLRDRVVKSKYLREKERLEGTRDENGKQNELNNNAPNIIPDPEAGNESQANKQNNDGSKKKGRNRKGKNKDEGCEPGSKRKPRANRRICAEWTEELHLKFIAAVNQLGEGRCYPKEILEIMNVPNLTRMQVASHLQKCRNDNWRSPDERKVFQAAAQTSSVNNDLQPKLNPRRFGSMPRVIPSSNPESINLEGSGINPNGVEIYSSSANSFTGNGNGEDVMQTIHPQPPESLQYSGTKMFEIQKMEQLAAFGTLSQKNGAEITCIVEDFNDISSTQNKYDIPAASGMGTMASGDSKPILSEPKNATPQPYYGPGSSNQNQFSNHDFLNFLPEISDPQSLSDLIGGSTMVDYKPTPQHAASHLWFQTNFP